MACAYKIGLVSSSGKYLTTDFDGKVSLTNMDASVHRMSKGQLWMVECQQGNGDDNIRSPVVSFYSTNGHYLTIDKSGKVSAEAEEIDDEQRFEVDAGGGGNGGWIVRSVVHEFYLGAKSKKVVGKKRETSSSDQRWYVRLSLHPHCCLYSDSQKTYARVQAGRLCFDAAVPWHADSLLELGYSEGYGYLRTSNGHYLNREGKFERDINHQCLFAIDVRGSRLMFKDYTGLFVSVNTRGRIVSTTGNERASIALIPSSPHVTFQQKIKNNWIKLLAKEVSQDLEAMDAAKAAGDYDDETVFDLSPLCFSTTPNSKWALMTIDKRSVHINSEAKLCVTSTSTYSAKQFEFEYERNAFFLRHSNEFVTINTSGKPMLTANREAVGGGLRIEISNRPKLILRGEFGFVKRDSGKNNKVKCYYGDYDDLTLTYELETNSYRIKGPGGRYWCMDSLGEHVIAPDIGQPTSFVLEIHALNGRAALSIRPLHQDHAHLLKGYKNGALTATGEAVSKETLWDFY